jgi:Uma2 family endonuclease
MVAVSDFQPMSPQAYLQWEAQQPLKYEYSRGEVVAMTGGRFLIMILPLI